MADQTVYEIARYRVDQPKEVLIETARIIETGGGLVKQGPDGRSMDVADVTTAIGADPTLHEVRANEITRITARADVVDELPFHLVAPGDPDDFDENDWSKELEKHVDPVYEHQVGVYRVLFVNGDRWCPWSTYTGQSMLPEAWPVIRLQQDWVGITLDHDNEGAESTHTTVLGLISDGVAGCYHEPDWEMEAGPQDVGVWRRSGTVEDDARIIVDWLLDSPFQRLWEFSIEKMLTRLFLETVAGETRPVGIGGHRLAVGDDPQPHAAASDADVWWMSVNLPPEVIDSVIEQLSSRDEALRDVVASLQVPNSPQAAARQEALSRIGLTE
jgi:hypothetical protein